MGLQEKVSRGYQQIAQKDPTGLVFDAQLEIDRLAERIQDELRRLWSWFPKEKE